MVGTKIIAKASAWLFENQTIWNPIFQKSRFQMFPDFKWSDFRYPLHLDLHLTNFSVYFCRSLPPEIGDLVQLRELMLAHNYLRSLPFELGKLFQLMVSFHKPFNNVEFSNYPLILNNGSVLYSAQWNYFFIQIGPLFKLWNIFTMTWITANFGELG